MCGGRNYGALHNPDGAERPEGLTERVTLKQFLDSLNITELAHGGAPGADTLAGDWATQRGVPVSVYPADWNNPQYQRVLPSGRVVKFAGNVRNQEMLDSFHPDAVAAMPGARGTADMCRRATAAGIPVLCPGYVVQDSFEWLGHDR